MYLTKQQHTHTHMSNFRPQNSSHLNRPHNFMPQLKCVKEVWMVNTSKVCRLKHTENSKTCETSSSLFLRACFLVYVCVHSYMCVYVQWSAEKFFFQSHFGSLLNILWGFFYVLWLHYTLIESIHGLLNQIKLFLREIS